MASFLFSSAIWKEPRRGLCWWYVAFYAHKTDSIHFKKLKSFVALKKKKITPWGFDNATLFYQWKFSVNVPKKETIQGGKNIYKDLAAGNKQSVRFSCIMKCNELKRPPPCHYQFLFCSKSLIADRMKNEDISNREGNSATLIRVSLFGGSSGTRQS